MDPRGRRHERFFLPTLVWLCVFFALPLASIILVSLAGRGQYGGAQARLDLSSYIRLADPLYLKVFLRSFALAAANTLICAVLAFPLSYWMARQPRRKQSLLVLLVLIPFWTNVLVRLYAWVFILGRSGPLNSMAMGLGLMREPAELLFTWRSILIGLVYEHLPFMILPLYAALEKVDWALVDAARDLYATPWRAFLRVVLPLSRPGLVAGGILVFVWTLGDFVTPDLLGGGKNIMAGNLIQQQYLVLRDWPFGSAMSLFLMFLVSGGLALYLRQERAAS